MCAFYWRLPATHTPRNTHHQTGSVTNETINPIATIKVDNSGSRSCSAAMMEAVIIGGMAASNSVT